MHSEFDNYIDKYRDNLDKALSLSRESSDFFADYKAKKLKEWLPERVIKRRSILDFGCGDGVMTNYVSSYFPQAIVYGVDPSEKSTESAQQKFNHIQFSTNSTEDSHLLFDNETFDIIFSAGTFNHVDFNHHNNYLKELVRILKRDGCIVLFELNPLNPLTVITFKRNPIDKSTKMLTPWYAYNLVKKHGKTEIKFCCFFPKIFKLFRPAERLLTKLPFGALYATIMTA